MMKDGTEEVLLGFVFMVGTLAMLLWVSGAFGALQ